MSVPTDAVTEQVFVGAGTASPLSTSFEFLGGDDLVITAIVDGEENPEPLVRGVDYAVAGGNGSTGTVTPAEAIPVGTSWRVRRETPVGQPATLPSGSFQPEQIEAALDRQALISQEQHREITRALRVPRGEVAPALAPRSELAGKLLLVTEDGQQIIGAQAITAIVAQVILALTGKLYATTGLGLANTTNEQEFAVDQGDGTAAIYINDAGVATLTRIVIIAPSAPGSAALIGTTSPGGNMQAALDNVFSRLAALES